MASTLSHWSLSSPFSPLPGENWLGSVASVHPRAPDSSEAAPSLHESAVVSAFAHSNVLFPDIFSPFQCIIEGEVDSYPRFLPRRDRVFGTERLQWSRGGQNHVYHTSVRKGTWDPGEPPVSLGLRWRGNANSTLTPPGMHAPSLSEPTATLPDTHPQLDTA